jgi:hypothetical protein
MGLIAPERFGANWLWRRTRLRYELPRQTKDKKYSTVSASDNANQDRRSSFQALDEPSLENGAHRVGKGTNFYLAP